MGGGLRRCSDLRGSPPHPNATRLVSFTWLYLRRGDFSPRRRPRSGTDSREAEAVPLLAGALLPSSAQPSLPLASHSTPPPPPTHPSGEFQGPLAGSVCLLILAWREGAEGGEGVGTWGFGDGGGSALIATELRFSSSGCRKEPHGRFAWHFCQRGLTIQEPLSPAGSQAAPSPRCLATKPTTGQCPRRASLGSCSKQALGTGIARTSTLPEEEPRRVKEGARPECPSCSARRAHQAVERSGGRAEVRHKLSAFLSLAAPSSSLQHIDTRLSPVRLCASLGEFCKAASRRRLQRIPYCVLGVWWWCFLLPLL